MTIFIAVLAAAAAVFAVLFFLDRKDAKKFEQRAESLSREVGDLKCELARKENGIDEDYLSPLTQEKIVEFLKKEMCADVRVKGADVVSFSYCGVDYYFDCKGLPRQFVFLRGYSGLADADMNWDVFERAVAQTNKDVGMVKTNLYGRESYAHTVVSTTHTVAELRRDLDFFISILVDAERRLYDLYWKIMQEEYPEEYAARMQRALEQDELVQNAHGAGADQVSDEMAMRMAQMAAGNNKMQS